MIDPNKKLFVKGVERLCFLKNIITNPNIIVGDYTYYDDPEGINNFNKNVLYHFDFIGDKLIIGKFCQIASGVRFIMNGAIHSISGFSTFPFLIFGDEWGNRPDYPQSKGDTVIGNDVWIGNSVTIMPGIKIGDGAILATNAVITKDVEPYSIVGGNPGKLIRKRFDNETTYKLLKLKWWDWPIEKIKENFNDITIGNLSILKGI